MHGEQAVEAVKCVTKQYDIILMDLHMPVMNGFQAGKTLRNLHAKGVINLQQTKLIALSAITKAQYYNQVRGND